MVERKGGAKKKRRRRGRKAGGGTSSSPPGGGGDGGGKGGARRRDLVDRESDAPVAATPSSSSGGGSLVPPSYAPHKSLLIRYTESTPTWHELGRNAPGRNDTIFTVASRKDRVRRNPRGLADSYRSIADSIYDRELELFRDGGPGPGGSGSRSSSDERWVENTMRKGTLKDRIAATSVIASEEPFHKPYALDALLRMAGCDESGGEGMPNSRVAQMAAEALSDLFTETYLPSERRLVGLDERPLYLYASSSDGASAGGTDSKNRTLSPRLLLLWRYEELLKRKYTLFLSRYLSRTLSDSSSSDSHRIFALRTACRLLRDRPEGESTLLSLIVNKLGDPNRKVAAAAGHELRRVLEVHPNMVEIVAREVQQLAHRPRLSPRALYNCVIFLNQIRLSRSDDDENDAAKNDGEEGEENDAGRKKGSGKSTSSSSSSLPASLIDTYFRLFEVAIHKTSAPPPPKNGKKTKSHDDDDADVGMKGRLLSALLTGVNRARPYLATGEEDEKMEGRIDALYKIVHASPPRAKTQALTLLFQLVVGSPEGDDDDAGRPTIKTRDQTKETRTARFYRALYATLNDQSTLESGKHLTLYFNLLYKSMKYDSDDVRVVAFGKRLLCRSMHSNSTVVGGVLFLLSEVTKFREEGRNGGGLRVALEKETEDRRGTKEGGDGGDSAVAVVYDPTKREPRAAFVRRRLDSGGDDRDENIADDDGESTTVAKLWETSLLSRHYHPSVAKFSSDFLSGRGGIDYAGDPLRDFALMPFLDKFAYKNPKSASRLSRHARRGESVAERRSGMDGLAKKALELPLNDPSFADRSEVNEEDEFFHKFFVERRRRDELKGIVWGKSAGAEEGSEEEGDDALDRAEKGADVDRELDDDDDGWSTDPEEEAFVNDLAEKLMDGGKGGGEKANFDDEDPYMEGWSDDDSDDDGDKENEGKEEEGLDYSAMDGFGMEEGDGGERGPDADAFMDDGMGSSSDGEEDAAADDAATAENNSDDDDGSAAAIAMGGSDEDDDSDGNDAADGKKRSKKKESKKKPSSSSGTSLFADASEYETLIETGWSSLSDRKKKKKRSRESTEDKKNEDDAEEEEGEAAAVLRRSETDESHRSHPKKKKKKRKTKHKRTGGN